jgi:hypothetical protein
MSEQVVLLFRRDTNGEPDLFDAALEAGGEKPNTLWRVEGGGWVYYSRTDLWLPRKDGVFSRITVFVRQDTDVELKELLNFIVDTFSAPED